jgi:hypothetical protein
MKVIVYQQASGIVAIVRPTPAALASNSIESIAQKDVPAGLRYEVIEDDDVPSDRTFRNAWVVESGAVSVDMPMAREIHRDHLREMRKPLLEQSDVEFIRAIEARDLDLQAQIAAKKVALRDVTRDPLIEAARTPEELKAAIPLILRG